MKKFVSIFAVSIVLLGLESCMPMLNIYNTTITAPTSGSMVVSYTYNNPVSNCIWYHGSTALPQNGTALQNLQADPTSYTVIPQNIPWVGPHVNYPSLEGYMLCEVSWVPIITNTSNTIQLNIPATPFPSSINKQNQALAGFNASAYSLNMLTSGTDGFLEFQVGNVPTRSNVGSAPPSIVSSLSAIQAHPNDDFIIGFTTQYTADDPIHISTAIQYGLHFIYTWYPIAQAYIRSGQYTGQYRVFYGFSRTVKAFYNGSDMGRAIPYIANDKFTINKSGGNITFMKNGVPTSLVSLPVSSPQNLIVDLAASRPGMSLNYARTTFTNPLDNYTELAKDLDGSFYVVYGKLGIKYKEKYNNSSLKYTIYDWRRKVVADNSSSLVTSAPTLQNGYNYIQFDLSNAGLQNLQYYIMEIIDSKGEVYKVRFKYMQ